MHLDDIPHDLIAKHAQSYPTEEVCGAIVNGELVHWNNASITPKDNFLSPVLTNIDGISLVYHSHVRERDDDFSVQDIKASREMGVPWLLYHVPTASFRFYDPSEIDPYLGRSWNWVYRNCYTLMQDYYKQELGVELPDFYLESPRAWLRGKSVGYLENLPLCGFERVPDGEPLEKHDVILMFATSRVPNHVAILVDPDTNAMIQHLEGCLSEQTVYGGQEQKATHSVWRLRG